MLALLTIAFFEAAAAADLQQLADFCPDQQPWWLHLSEVGSVRRHWLHWLHYLRLGHHLHQAE